jgi:3-deoxy-D-manno-octulosonic-acid transferase
MRSIFISIYRLFIAPLLVILTITIGAWIVPKIRLGLKLRRQKRDWPTFAKKPVWIHASSGEFEYAKPFIGELKKRHPDLPVVVTYFSPTYANAIATFKQVDFSLPLPLDLPGPTREFLKRLNPSAGFIARTDLWPELLHQASLLKIPVTLFSATKTKTPTFLTKIFTRWLYSYLHAIYCVTLDDEKHIREIGLNKTVLAIGDTRFDQVIERLNFPRPLNDFLKPERSKTVIVGSSWPEDETVIFGALSEDLKNGQVQLILAPHEPTPGHLDAIEKKLKAERIPYAFYSKAATFSSGILIVDQVGILAELYQWAAVAVVGGSFKKSVHSVMEPLAAGCATSVGPFHQNNREAIEFKSLIIGNQPLVQAAESPTQLRSILKSSLANWSPSHAHLVRAQITKSGGASTKLADIFDSKS